MLQFKQALRFPVYIYGRVDISECIGRVRISSIKLSQGLWKIGQCTKYHGQWLKNHVTRLAIKGDLLLEGEGIVYRGANIYIEDGAFLRICSGVRLGYDCCVICSNKISIGENVLVSWQCQIMDTDFHYHIDGEIVKRKSRSITIGDGVWLGNRVSVGKGASIGDGCIVASNSLVNKDFSTTSNIMIGGIPAKLLRKQVCRDDNYLYDLFFKSNPDKDFAEISSIIV